MFSALRLRFRTRNGKVLTEYCAEAELGLRGANAGSVLGELQKTLDYARDLPEGDRKKSRINEGLGFGFAVVGRHLAKAKGGKKKAMAALIEATKFSQLSRKDLLQLAVLLAEAGRVDSEAWGVYLDAYRSGLDLDANDIVASRIRSACEITYRTPFSAILQREKTARLLHSVGCKAPWMRYTLAVASKTVNPNASIDEYICGTGPRENSAEEEWLFEARIRSLAGQMDVAGELLADLSSSMSASEDYCITVGLHCLRTGQLEKAEDSLTSLTGDLMPPISLVELIRGHIAFGRAQFAKAQHAYAAANAIDPSDWRPQYWLGRVHLCLGRNEDALNLFKNSLNLHANDYSSHAIGVACELLGKYVEAIEAYTKLSEETPLGKFARLQSARCLALAGKWEDISSTVCQLLDTKDYGDAAKYLAGLACVMMDQIDSGLFYWRKVELPPWRQCAINAMGIALCLRAEKNFESGEWDKATEIWKEALLYVGDEFKLYVELNIGECAFRRVSSSSVAMSDRDRLQNELLKILPTQPSPRREYYALVLASVMKSPPPREICRLLGDKSMTMLSSNKRFGARAAVHCLLASSQNKNWPIKADAVDVASVLRDSPPPLGEHLALSLLLVRYLRHLECGDADGALAMLAEFTGAIPSNPVPNSIDKAVPRVGKNDPCPCGSGKKFKTCCGT